VARYDARLAGRCCRRSPALLEGTGAHGARPQQSEIGERPVIAETTAKTHVARILMKLGPRDRAQAVMVAYESGLVEPGIDIE